jgi:hypothetical protein
MTIHAMENHSNRKALRISSARVVFEMDVMPLAPLGWLSRRWQSFIN